MDEVLVGLWIVYEDTSEELERVDEGFVVDGAPVSRLVDDTGVCVESES